MRKLLSYIFIIFDNLQKLNLGVSINQLPIAVTQAKSTLLQYHHNLRLRILHTRS